MSMIERAQRFPAAVTHGFTTREGGVSLGRYTSLNLGGRWGDDPGAVAENLRRAAVAGGFRPDELVRARQVHGAAVLAAHTVDEASEADAIWLSRAHLRAHPSSPRVVGVMTADCVPILLCDREASVVAAVHSGWRGTVADIAGATVAVLREAGADPADLFAAIGPCIEAPAFEVGEEVAAQFAPEFVVRAGPTGPYPKPHVDLVACVRAQLEAAGVPAGQIERVGACTHTHEERYFSFRRDGAGIGQMLSFIGLGPA